MISINWWKYNNFYIVICYNHENKSNQKDNWMDKSEKNLMKNKFIQKIRMMIYHMDIQIYELIGW